MPLDEPDAISPPASLGPFRIDGVLGQGGSAVVYASELRGTPVALKVPRPDRELSPKEQERFLEEARMLQRVRHQSVVEVLDAGRLPGGEPYLLMRRYEGQTLADRLAAKGPLPLAHALDLFEQLAAATSALHEAGLVHRDLKPENVFLVDEGRGAKLLDFGIAKDRDAPASTTTQAGVARGTPATMAPERFFGAPATVSSDVYELSVVLYAMLAGRLPWSDVTNVDARLNPVPLIETGVAVPERVSSVILQALSTRPERRPESVADLSNLVREAAIGTPAQTARVTAETPTVPPPPSETLPSSVQPESSSSGALVVAPPATTPQRRRTVVALALAGGLVAGLVGAAVLAPGSESEARTAPKRAAEPPTAPTLVVRAAQKTAAALTASAPALPTATASAPKAVARVQPTVRPVPVRTTKPAPSSRPPAKSGLPRGAACGRSSECASMLCAAETCQ